MHFFLFVVLNRFIIEPTNVSSKSYTYRAYKEVFCYLHFRHRRVYMITIYFPPPKQRILWMLCVSMRSTYSEMSIFVRSLSCAF